METYSAPIILTCKPCMHHKAFFDPNKTKIKVMNEFMALFDPNKTAIKKQATAVTITIK